MWNEEGIYSYEKQGSEVIDDTETTKDEIIDVMANWWWEYDATKQHVWVSLEKGRERDSRGSLKYFKIPKDYDWMTTRLHLECDDSCERKVFLWNQDISKDWWMCITLMH